LERVKDEARRAAVEFVSGVHVRSNFLSFDQVRNSNSNTLIQELITTSATAWVVEEKILRSHREFLEGGAYRQSLHLQARLLDRTSVTDPGFEVEVEIDSARRFEGEGVTITLSCTRDAHIYVLALYPGGADLLLPNKSRPNTFVEAHSSLVFPSPSEKTRGMRLIATLPPGLSDSTETLLVLAMRGEQEHPEAKDLMEVHAEADDAGMLLSDFLVPLIELLPDDWALNQTSYQIFAR
jgi:hypothetical protein